MAHPCCSHGDRRRLLFVPGTVVTGERGGGGAGGRDHAMQYGRGLGGGGRGDTSLYKTSSFVVLYFHRNRSLLGRRIVQELCESRGGRPGSVLKSLLVSVDVKLY